jgi:hypothetical protein
MSSGFISTTEAKFKAALIFIWLLMQVYMLGNYGVRFMGDSAGYIAYAQNIADSFHFAKTHQLKYFGYPLFMAGIFKVGFGLWGVILAQTLLSGVATLAIYQTTKQLANNIIAPLLATFLFIVWYDMQQYNGFILTESLYISLIIIGFYLLVKAGANIKKSLWALPFLLFVAMVRPNGFIALVAYAGYAFVLVFNNTERKRVSFRLIVLLVFVPIASVLLADRYLLQNFDIVDTYQLGQVIFMYPELTVNSNSTIIMPPADISPLAKIMHFALHNTSYFLKMSGLRLLLFWANVKPYFSIVHNMVIILILYPCYYFAVRAIINKYIPAHIAVFAIMILGQQAFITTVTSEDWNGRFLMSLIAFVFVLGSIGLSKQIEKWVKMKEAKSQSPISL